VYPSATPKSTGDLVPLRTITCLSGLTLTTLPPHPSHIRPCTPQRPIDSLPSTPPPPFYRPHATFRMEKELYKLEVLSLVQKISQEIMNHACSSFPLITLPDGAGSSSFRSTSRPSSRAFPAINDKALAEFVISLHGQSKTLPEFKKKLEDIGAGFPESFVENME
jgi:hypothetical protein